MAVSKDRMHFPDDPMHMKVPQLSDYEGVEIMIVARPQGRLKRMGAATVGKGHRNTTCTGARGDPHPKGQGRRAQRDLVRPAQLARGPARS